MSNEKGETVCVESGGSDTERLRVTGGWLYRRELEYGITAMCFVPEVEAKMTKRQRCEASLCKEHIGAVEETAGDAVLKLEAIKEELAHWKEAHKQLSVELRSRGALLVSAEKERDQANARRSSHAKARDKWAKDHARQKKEIEALKLELKIRLHAANSLLHGVEGERDEARAELAAGGVVPRSKEQIFALAAKEERGRAREVRLVYPIVATRSNDGREWVRVVTKEGGDE